MDHTVLLFAFYPDEVTGYHDNFSGYYDDDAGDDDDDNDDEVFGEMFE